MHRAQLRFKCACHQQIIRITRRPGKRFAASQRRSNALHCRVVDLARQIERACKDGIEDSLDPACAKVFQKSLGHSYEMMKLSMTEMQGHMGKGKWG